MSEPSEELQELIEDTTSALGATDQTYIQLLKLFQREGTLSLPSRVFTGQMVFFKYKPMSESFISRNTYYDSYPMVLICDTTKEGFEGINLHYLHPQYRTFLFEQIVKRMPVLKSGDEWRNRLLIDYDRLKSHRSMKFFRACYRRYLWKAMRRRPAILPYEMWEQLVAAETSRFVGAKPVTVYRDSYHKVIRRGR
jgi:hypothetical protein